MNSINNTAIIDGWNLFSEDAIKELRMPEEVRIKNDLAEGDIYLVAAKYTEDDYCIYKDYTNCGRYILTCNDEVMQIREAGRFSELMFFATLLDEKVILIGEQENYYAGPVKIELEDE